MIKLSIIIPAYIQDVRLSDYLAKLVECLLPQKTKEVEIIIVDDGSKVKFKDAMADLDIKIIEKENGGVSSARNAGLKAAKGEYIVFVDADDLVSDDYVNQIMAAVKSKPDTVYLSWKSICGRLGKIIQSESDEFNPANRCVWNRVFSKEYIRGIKFDESMQVAEDDDFLRRLPEAKHKTYVPKPIYYYRAGVKGGLTDRKLNGEFQAPDIKTQVVVYCGNAQTIGGVETFIYEFCKEMCKYYDIMVLYSEHMDARQIMRLAMHVQVMRNQGKVIQCDTLINIRLTDDVPGNVRYGKRIQMSHTCQLAPSGKWHWTIKKNYDELIFVSQAAGDSFADQGLTYQVIPNLTEREKPKKALLLVSACRLTWEKGEERMYQLAEMFRNANIPFTWLVFSGQTLKKTIPGVVHCQPTLDVRSYFEKADYVVQLSDIESFCYTIAEALELGTPVLTTPIAVLPEIGFQEGVNGWIVPFNIKDADVTKYYEQIPESFEKPNRNDEIVKKWRKVLGNTKPSKKYVPDTEFVKVVVTENYGDLELGRNMTKGEVVTMRAERAIMLINRGYAEKV